MAKASKPIAPIAMPTSQSQSVRIEKISNGYLAHHSTDNGNNYSHKTVFHPNKPSVTVAVVPPKGKK